MIVLFKLWMIDPSEFVDHVVIDLCAKSFLLVGSKKEENLIECDTTDEFMGVLKVCKEYLKTDQIEYADYHLRDTKDLQKKLFDEIKGRIKLDDESLPYKDHTYEYWTKTTAKGNYSIKLRKKIRLTEY